MSRPILIERHSIGRDVFYTTPLFWDCECEDNYIHDCLCGECLACGVSQQEAPDARVDEVLRYAPALNDALVTLLEGLCERTCPQLTAIPF